MADDDMPEWTLDQIGRRYRGPRTAGYETKISIVRRYARELAAAGRKVDHQAIRELLAGLDRGYSTKSKEISAALAPLRASGTVAPYPNGHGVSVEGRPYRSVREAARAEKLGVETVRRRLKDPNYKDWIYGRA